MSNDLTIKHGVLDIKTILLWCRDKRINLSPGFQRNSVWQKKDQQMLIDSILKGMPLPSLFFWENKTGRKVVYAAIDGKQRIESLLAFTRARAGLSINFVPEKDSDWKIKDKENWNWKEITEFEPKIKKQFLQYKLPVVFLNGNLADVEQVFIRINSTGKPLSKQEARRARWYQNSYLLQAAEEVASRLQKYFVNLEILSPNQISRMKAIEMVSEFMLSINREDVLDRKKALDQIMAAGAINRHTVVKLGKTVISVLNIIKTTFPDLKTSRFRRPTDFYALFFVIWKMKRDGYTFKDKKAAKVAFLLLNQISLELAAYSAAARSGKRHSLKSPPREYHLTVVEGTDTARNRHERVRILESILTSIFPKKDGLRLFTPEQKQLLWHTSKDKCCAFKGCKRNLSWDTVQIDHVLAHSKGGKTDLTNAQLMCAYHNQSKSDN